MALEAKASGLLIDVRDFAHKPTEDVMAYRKEHVIPLYDQAGIRRMAFLFAGDTPGTANQDPGGNYEVKNFVSEREAVAWASNQST